MMKTMRNIAIVFFCTLLLLSTTSCFVLVTGGDVDKEWPRNNSKNPRHSTTTSPSSSDSTKVETKSKSFQ